MGPRNRTGAIRGLVGAGAIIISLFATLAVAQERFWIKGVELAPLPEGEKIIFTFNREPVNLGVKQFEGKQADGTEFIALDLSGAVQEPSYCVVPGGGQFIKKVVYAQNSTRPDIVRVVLHLLRPVEVNTETSGPLFTIYATAPLLEKEPPLRPAAPPPPPKVEKTPSPSPSSPPPVEEAAQPTPSSPAPSPEPVEEKAGDLPRKPLITMNMRDADIKGVLWAFSRETGLNVVTNEDVSGTITVILKEVTPQEALEAILRSRGYNWKRRGNTLFVTAKRPIKTFRLQYITASDCKDVLAGVISGDVRLAADDGLNTLTVEASPEDLEKVSAFVSDIDSPPYQVLTEAKIIELNAGDESVLATNLSKAFSLPDTSVTASTQYLADATTAKKSGFYIQVVKTNFTALLEAMQKRSDFSLLANPNILTLNHQEAAIYSGEKYGYKTKTVTETTTVEKVEFLEVGTKLKFKPHINEAGYIIMEIYPEVSEGEVVDGIPQERTTNTSSVVMINDGETIAIGGLIKKKATEVNTGVPVLSQLPLVGALFRRVATDVDRKEIIIFITPHIVEPLSIKPPVPEELKTLEDKFEKKYEPWILP